MEIALLEEDVDFNWTDQVVLSLRGKKTTELAKGPNCVTNCQVSWLRLRVC